MKTSTVWCLACLVAVASPSALAQPVRLKGASFRALGDLPGGRVRSQARGVSLNGTVVVGQGESGDAPSPVPMRWTPSGGMQPLGVLPNTSGLTTALSVNFAGTVIVGRSITSEGSEAFVWTAATGTQSLGDLAGGRTNSGANDCSADGAVIVGYGQTSPDIGATQAMRWTASTGMIGLGDLPGGATAAGATSVSSDGNVIVGYGTTEAGSRPWRWTPTDGMIEILNGGGVVGEAIAEDVSGNGTVVVGYGRVASGGWVAFRWTPIGGMESLGELPGGSEFGRAYGVSSDGSVIVGQSNDNRGNRAFIWTRQLGMRDLADYLTSVGVNLGGYQPFIAFDVSPDGRWIVGQCLNPSGDQEAFLASLPLNVVPAVAAIANPLPRASLRSVGDLPGGERYSLALALSPSGTHCSVDSDGASGRGLAVYSNGNLLDCGWPSHPGTQTVVGTGITTVGGQPIAAGILQDDLYRSHALKWSAMGGYQVLSGLPGTSEEYAYGISDNGQTVVGGCFVPSDGVFLPCAWIDGVPVQLADLAGGGASAFAFGCSSDGTVIVGAAWGTLSTNEPVIWNRATGTVTSLGLIPGFGFGGAIAVSGNGTSVVGRFFNEYPDRIGQAFRWSATGGMELLSTLPGYPGTYASAVSGDGTIVVGTIEDPAAGTSEACLWMPGPMKVRDLLQLRGVDVSAWRLLGTNGVSRDGRYLCGSGFNLITQSYEGWVADLGLD